MKDFLITISLFCLLERQQASIFNSNACSTKTITPMANFILTKVNFILFVFLIYFTENFLIKSFGVWYNFASSSNYDDATKKCFKKNYKGLLNGSLLFDESYIEWVVT